MQLFAPVFILALFGPVPAGLYAFAVRIVRAPLLVISTAVGSVLRKEGVDHLSREGNLVGLYVPIVRGLFLLGALPFLVTVFFGRELFAVAFGAQWAEAGRVVQILSPGIFLEFVAFPLGTFFLITNNQHYTFRLQLLGFVLLVAGLVIGRRYLGGFTATCVLISAVMAAANVATIVLAARVSRRQRAEAAAPHPTVAVTA